MANHKSRRHFIQDARRRMAAKGTVGAFGKATPKKIARAIKHGGLEKKRAVFARTMKKIAKRRRRRGAKRGKRGG